MSAPTQDDVTRATLAGIGRYTLGGYWACLPGPRHTRHLVEVRKTAGGRLPMPEAYKVFAVELCLALNREIALDGQWLVAWSDFDLTVGHPRRFDMIWRDRDGDMPFYVTCEDPIDLAVLSVDLYIEQALEAGVRWQAMMKDLEVRAADQIKAALGEPSADAQALPDVIPAALD